jgi:TolA-binding protein
MRGHSVTAFIYSAEKKTDEAKKEYADEVKEFPKSPRAHLDFGLFYMGEKNYKAASDEMENAMALDRAFMPPYFRAGQLAVLSNTNLAHGEELLRKYLTYTPKQGEPATARAHYWLGQIFEKQGKKAEAKGQLCGVAQTQPEPEGCHGGAEGFRKAHRS